VVVDSRSEDLARLGLPPEQIATLTAVEEGQGGDEEPPFEVWPSNWLAVQVFLDCALQWRVNAKGVPQAIDRAALRGTVELWPVPADQQGDTFHRVRLMEYEVASEYKRRFPA